VTVYCYAAPKPKSQLVCRAFAAGCAGKVITDCVLRDGPAMFYGIALGQDGLWRAARTRGEWMYADNSLFDVCRERYFRVTRNRLQHSGLGISDGKRLAGLGLAIEPWRGDGRHVLVCPQSDWFMRAVVGYAGDWTADVVRALQRVTRRKIRIRDWGQNKSKQSGSLEADLDGAHIVVTWSSAAAVTAILAGVPAVCLGQSAAAPMATSLVELEAPHRPEGREQWAAVLADQQWTLDEMRNGTAWRALNP
jgi:hypothetical protein